MTIEMLKGKKKGAYAIIEIDPNYVPKPIFWNMKKSRSSMSIMAVVLKHTRSAENAGAA